MSSISNIGPSIAPAIQPKPAAPAQQPAKPVAPKPEVENDGDADDGGTSVNIRA